MKSSFKLLTTLLLALGGCLFASDSRPNIVWIFAEDTSPWMGTYGHEANKLATPHIDSIAKAGVRFDRAYVPFVERTRSKFVDHTVHHDDSRDFYRKWHHFG